MGPSRLLLALLAVSACSALEGQHRHKCQRITIPLCRDMPYNLTRMPNLVDHETQEEAAELVCCLHDCLQYLNRLSRPIYFSPVQHLTRDSVLRYPHIHLLFLGSDFFSQVSPKHLGCFVNEVCL